MVGMPDLKPIWTAMERMVTAFDRLAAAIEEQNRIASESNSLTR